MYKLIRGITMNHYNYKITNLLDGKQYYGVRSCECLPEDDTEYMSSSKLVKADITELGIENFEKVVTATFDTRAEALQAEEDVLKSVDAGNCEGWYNQTNGNLLFCTQGKTKETDESIARNAEKQKLNWELNKEEKVAKIHHPDRDYSNHEKSLSSSRGQGKSKLTGTDRTEAQRRSAEASRERMLSGSNPAYSPEAVAKRVATITGRKRPEHAKALTGRKSIHKDGVQKNVKAEDVSMYLADGWVLGGLPKGKPQYKEQECPHCGKLGKGGNMKRYHFDNCKMKGD